MALIYHVPQVRLPYRATRYGGFDFSYMFDVSGKLIKPTYEERSRSGRHGEDVYELQPGTYYAVVFTRPNGPKRPITITYMRITVSSNETHKEVIRENEVPEPVLAKAKAIHNRLISG